MKETGEGGTHLSSPSHSIPPQLIPDHPAPLLNTILYERYTRAFPFIIATFNQIFHN